MNHHNEPKTSQEISIPALRTGGRVRAGRCTFSVKALTDGEVAVLSVDGLTAENNTAEETDRGAYSTDDSPPSSTSGDKDEPQAKTKEIEQLACGKERLGRTARQ